MSCVVKLWKWIFDDFTKNHKNVFKNDLILPLDDENRLPQPHWHPAKPVHLFLVETTDGFDMCHKDRAPIVRNPGDCWIGDAIDLNAPERAMLRKIWLILMVIWFL